MNISEKKVLTYKPQDEATALAYRRGYNYFDDVYNDGWDNIYGLTWQRFCHATSCGDDDNRYLEALIDRYAYDNEDELDIIEAFCIGFTKAAIDALGL
jgi:hypothetical protein